MKDISKPWFINKFHKYLTNGRGYSPNIPGYNRSSNLAWECNREGFYNAVNSPVSEGTADIDVDLGGIFWIGNTVHKELPKTFREAGIIVSDGFRIWHDGFGLTGTLDNLIYNPKLDETFLIEFKTIDPKVIENPNSKYFLPYKKHKLQWAAYDLLIRKGKFTGSEIPGDKANVNSWSPNEKHFYDLITKYKGRGWIIYINKNNANLLYKPLSTLKVSDIKKEFVNKLKYVMNHIKKGSPPPRHTLCKKTNAMGKNCQYFEYCYSKNGDDNIDFRKLRLSYAEKARNFKRPN